MAMIILCVMVGLICGSVLGVIGFLYYQRRIKPIQKDERQMSRGLVPDSILPVELQYHDAGSSGGYAKKPKPEEWADRQTRIQHFFTNNPHKREEWERARARRA